MADVHQPEVRSYNMRRIRSRDTKPELIVRQFLHGHGFRYSLHRRDLPGTPDLVLRQFKTVLFVHGCFWHGHEGCKYFVTPKTRTSWWLNKIGKNKLNDDKHHDQLEVSGWNVITVYECDLKPAKKEATLKRLLGTMKALKTAGK